MKNVIIRPATKDDLTVIYDIERSTSLNPWTMLQLQNALAQSGAVFLVALVDDVYNNEIVGFIIANIVLDELQIGEIAVKQNSQNMGVGSALIKKLFATAKSRGATFATLEVRASNVRAISLYEKFGFAKDAVRAKYYQDGEDAVLMSAKIL